MGIILLNNHLTRETIPDKLKINKFLSSVFLNEGIIFKKITYIFCKDDFLLTLNKKFLQHSTFTDIITFRLSDDEKPLISEIYISVERVKENATSLDISFTDELYRVMIHGILHLCGYNDKTVEQKKQMRKRENLYLQQLSFT